MAELPSQQLFPAMSTPTERVIESQESKSHLTIEALIEELDKTKSALRAAEAWINKATIERLKTADVHARQLETVKADFREEIANQEATIFRDSQDHQADLHSMSREHQAALFAQSQKHEAEQFARSRDYAAELYAQQKEHTAELLVQSQKHEAEALEWTKEQVNLKKQHRMAVEGHEKDEDTAARPHEKARNATDELHVADLEAQLDSLIGRNNGLVIDLCTKEYAQEAAIRKAKKSSAEEANRLLANQASKHEHVLATQALHHSNALTAQEKRFEAEMTELKAKSEKKKVRADNLTRENKTLKEKQMKMDIKGLKTSLSQANATIGQLKTQNQTLEDRIKKQLKTSESKVKDQQAQIVELRAKNASSQPLVRTAVDIRKRFMIQGCRCSGGEACLGIHERQVCDSIVERGNKVAHEPDGDLDSLIFEKNLLSGMTWDRRFHELYGIAVNDWQTLAQPEKTVRNAKALLKSRGAKAATDRTRAEVERLIRVMESLKPEDFEDDHIKVYMKELDFAKLNFLEQDRWRG